MFSSKSDNWETPQWLFENLNKEFNFELDVCANFENTKCAKFYSEEDDGLQQQWDGSCWCNPPYGRKVCEWVKKAYDSVSLGTKIVMLLPARTDTKWFHDYIYNKFEVRFLKGRLKFGDSKNSAPFPSMIVVFK
jgi:phage N-6-adenine-methyltransferase